MCIYTVYTIISTYDKFVVFIGFADSITIEYEKKLKVVAAFIEIYKHILQFVVQLFVNVQSKLSI